MAIEGACMSVGVHDWAPPCTFGQRAVRILLECCLISNNFGIFLRYGIKSINFFGL